MSANLLYFRFQFAARRTKF